MSFIMECTKVKFGSQGYAEYHITKHRKKNADKGLKARAYQCPKCNCWHITSQVVNEDLIKDNESLRNQLVEQIKKNVDLKAEVEVLKEHLKNAKPIENSFYEKEINSLKWRLKKEKDRLMVCAKEKTQLLLKLSKYVKI